MSVCNQRRVLHALAGLICFGIAGTFAYAMVNAKPDSDKVLLAYFALSLCLVIYAVVGALCFYVALDLPYRVTED